MASATRAQWHMVQMKRFAVREGCVPFTFVKKSASCQREHVSDRPGGGGGSREREGRGSGANQNRLLLKSYCERQARKRENGGSDTSPEGIVFLYSLTCFQALSNTPVLFPARLLQH